MSTNKKKAQDRSARAAAAMAEAKRRERKRNMVIGAAVVVVLVVIVGVIAVVTTRSGEVDAAEAGASEYGLTIGSDDAPRQVVIYEDFLCPFCGELEATAGEDLSQLAEDGDVQVEYRPISILGQISDYSPEALNAFFVVLDESGPEVAKAFHDALYADQPSEQGPFPDTDDLVATAVDAGADEDAVRPGIEGMSMQDKVDAAGKEAQDANVRGTPTVLLDGQQFNDGSTAQDLGTNLVDEIRG